MSDDGEAITSDGAQPAETTAVAAPVEDRILSADTPTPDTIGFVCPRCGQQTTDRNYGPCATCRSQLQARFVVEERDVEAPEYEPKMNVTPNAIATKE